jgi:hypothetical protein
MRMSQSIGEYFRSESKDTLALIKILLNWIFKVSLRKRQKALNESL